MAVEFFFFSKKCLRGLLLPTFYDEIFKQTVKRRKFYSEPRYLESAINGLLCLLYHLGTRPLIHLTGRMCQSKLEASSIPTPQILLRGFH